MKSSSNVVVRGCWRHLSLAVLGLAALFSQPAMAALGDDEAQVEADGARLRASVKVARHPRYAVHALELPTGTTIRQYVGDAGKVFAVSWSGGWRPDLRDVMGQHYDRYIAASRGRRIARGPVRMELPGMVVVMGGRLRSFWGQVYLTDLVPAGFDVRGVAP